MLYFISSYLQKQNNDLELVIFYLYLHQNLPYFILYQWAYFQYQTFTPQDIYQPVFKFHYQSASPIFSNGHLGKKESKMEVQKFESHMGKRSFFHKIGF